MLTLIFEIPKSVEIQQQLTSVQIDEWLKKDVFIFRWWLLLGLIFVVLIIWWKLLDKSILHEIFLYVVLSTIIVIVIAEYGDELILWYYPTDILPIFPALTSINLLSLPLIYSLAYQYFKTTKGFIWATLIITAVICFVIEPILSLGNLYHLLHWRYYYSFPIYAVLAILTRFIVLKICKINKAYKNKIDL